MTIAGRFQGSVFRFASTSMHKRGPTRQFLANSRNSVLSIEFFLSLSPMSRLAATASALPRAIYTQEARRSIPSPLKCAGLASSNFFPGSDQ